MNKVTILLILSCAAVYAAEGDVTPRERESLKQCFTQAGLDYVKVSEDTKTMSKDELIKKITPHKMGCIGICFLKQKYDKIPVRQHILESLNKAETQNPDGRLTEFVDKIKKCMDEEDDCVLMQCLTPWYKRIVDIIGQ